MSYRSRFRVLSSRFVFTFSSMFGRKSTSNLNTN